MKFWKRASGALKDGTSLVKASFIQRSAFRNPDIEATVIRATNHDESCVDYRNAQRVFAWVAISDDYLRQVLWALSHRMWRTHNWVVVLKGLMLVHGVFCCKVPGIQEIGRLPFDMINFKRGKLYYDFIRAYYAFLDEKSTFIFEQQKQKSLDLIWLQKLQGLLDLLLQIRPKSMQTVNVLVLEAMDCVVIEIYDICARICNGITSVVVTNYSDAKTVLSILQKAKVQHERLSLYFRFCKEIGVGNAFECPKMEHISQQAIPQLEHIINGDSERPNLLITHDLDSSTSLKKSNKDHELIHLFSSHTRTNPLVQQNILELPDLISF